MPTYSGSFDNKNWYRTFKDGQPFSAVRSLKVRNHSPDGFAWGYGGSGPSQLALGILLEETDQETAERLYMDFKWAVTSSLPEKNWRLTSEEIQNWLNQKGRAVSE